MIIPVAENIWILEGSNVNFYSFPYPTRSIVIRLEDSSLWIWSPIQFNPEIKEFLEKLGKVKHLVSPNMIHHLFLNDWKLVYPNAKLWGPKQTLKKRSDLQFEAALNDSAPTEWQQEIEQYAFGSLNFFEEIVFFHKASKTVIFADLSENFSDDFMKRYWSWWKRKIAHIWKITEPYGYAPLELRLSWFKKKTDRKKLNQILNQKPERVIMAHGVWQPSNGEQFIRKSFKWLL